MRSVTLAPAPLASRFVGASESDGAPEYVELLIAASRDETVLTNAFNTGWANAPHRVLRSALEAAQQFDGSVIAPQAAARSHPSRHRRR
jgi:nitronate monooxygenase